MKANITCREAVDFISKNEERKLTIWQRVQLSRHLAFCSLCHTFSLQNKTIIKALTGFRNDTNDKLSEAHKQQIIETVLAEDR